MSTKHLVFVAALASSLIAGHAFAESEGNGEPFAFHADAWPSAGRAFVSETGSAAYPAPTGNRSQPSSLALLEPGLGSEAPVQTANSVPPGSGSTVASAQGPRPGRRFAGKRAGAPFLETGTAWPRG